MTNHTLDAAALEGLVAALNGRERAKLARAEDNPLHEHDLKQLAGGAGIRNGADLFPAKNVAEQGGLGYDMEVARNQAHRDAKADKSAKRMAQARARAARKVDFDKIVESPGLPDPKRMDEAWLVIAPLVKIVSQIAKSKQRWSARFLGSVTDDTTQMTLLNMATLLAKSGKDLDLLRRAAEELGSESRRTGQVPGDQLSEEERKERKELGKARKWLMSVANNRVHSTLVDTYLRSPNLRWQNLDLIATVMASISGVGDDPMTARFKADRAPAFMGTRFQKPGGLNVGMVATAINAAITERGLDRMAELLLDEENLRTDGGVRWSKVAEQVFLASPDGLGAWMWDAVEAATAHHERPRKGRGEAAKRFARLQFAFLPRVIVALPDVFDPRLIGWSFTGDEVALNDLGEPVRVRLAGSQQRRAVMASDYDLFYAPEPTMNREPLVPALRFGTAKEAAQVLAETIGALTTGEDVVMSLMPE